MRKPWHTPHSAAWGTVLISIIVASLAVASAQQPSRTNAPAPNAQAGTNIGPGMDFMSRAWTNARPGINPILTQPREEADQLNALKRRAEQGGARDQCSLGLAYYWGSGVAQDYAEAVKWYRKAAEQGNADAQYNLGVCYTEGQGVERDYTEAAKWYRRAAEQGSPLAQYNLGVCYTEGQGVEKDYTEAAKWWRKAAEQDDAQAQCNLALCYSLGQGMAKDYTEAVKWFRRAAEQGDSFGQLSLAFCYEEGNGVTKDYAEAATWFRKAADQGNASAQFNLGVLYTEEGQGVERDYAQAVKWWRRAAEQGNAYAQISLAFCYEDGNGVAKDDIEAYKWLNLAAAQGNPGAFRWRDLIAADMTKDDIAEAQRRSARFIPKKETPKAARAPYPPALPSDEHAPQPSGSGFFVTEDGWLVTSFHVVEGAAHILIRTEKETLPAKLINADKVNDVAVLKVSGKFAALPVAPSRATKLGETVLTIGFPNIGLQGFALTVTKGQVSGLTGARDDPREFQISVAVQPRDSGAPLVNQYGNVVGVVEARPADNPALKSAGPPPQNVNYAVKSSVLSVLLESLPELASKLKEPYPATDRKFEDVVNETKSATALVLVY
jgi:TPR repeat protein